MAKEGTRTPEAVLAAIEDDLRRDELIWKRIHSDLRSLGAPRPHRSWRWVAAAAAVLVLVAGSFVVGRTTAPATAPATAVAQAATPFTATGLESKREGFAARYGSIWGWGPAVTETTAPDGAAVNLPAAGPGFRPKWGQTQAVNETTGAEFPACTAPGAYLDARREGFVGRFGRTWACGQL